MKYIVKNNNKNNNKKIGLWLYFFTSVLIASLEIFGMKYIVKNNNKNNNKNNKKETKIGLWLYFFTSVLIASLMCEFYMETSFILIGTTK